MCGLKPGPNQETRTHLEVTPYTGVWIETVQLFSYCRRYRVTPYTGVWIETHRRAQIRLFSTGHTLYRCVDLNLFFISLVKPSSGHTLYRCVDWNLALTSNFVFRCVTPYTGVWIETSPVEHRKLDFIGFVTPYTGVWIETSLLYLKRDRADVTPYTGVWIETWWNCGSVRRSCVTPYTGVWIETSNLWTSTRRSRIVTPYTGVWIETVNVRWYRTVIVSHLIQVCGLKPLHFIRLLYATKVTPYTGVWIETQMTMLNM